MRGALLAIVVLSSCGRAEPVVLTVANIPASQAPAVLVVPPAIEATKLYEERRPHPAFIEIPAVACNTSGQTGFHRTFVPPTLRAPYTKAIEELDAPASQLRAYSDSDTVVLGPPGWQCFGSYGSGGGHLLIAPNFGEPGDEGIGFRLAGGGGFGRESAARIASPHALVTTVEAENTWRVPFDTTPWPNEPRTVDGPLVRYEDPPFVKGTAEEFGFVPNALSIFGSIRALSDTSIAGIAIRLDAERAVLFHAIQADFEARAASCAASESFYGCWGTAGVSSCGVDNPCK